VRQRDNKKSSKTTSAFSFSALGYVNDAPDKSKQLVLPMTEPIQAVMPDELDTDIVRVVDEYVLKLHNDPWVDERGILSARGEGNECMIRCSKSMIDWSAGKFKAILSALKASGCLVQFRVEKVGHHETMRVKVTHGEATLSVRIDEPTTRREKPLDAEEKRRKKEYGAKGWSFWRSNPWLYTPTKKPKFIFAYWRKRTIGEKLLPLVQAVIDELNERNNRAVASRVEQRHKRAKYLLRLRVFRRQLWEKRQFKAIEKEAKRWARAERLRGYLNKIESFGQSDVSHDWMTTTRKLIDNLDPLSSSATGKIVSPPKYAEVERILDKKRQKRYW